MAEVVAFHRLSFDLAGLSPRPYDSPYFAPAENNVFVIDGDIYFACHQVHEHADPTEDLTDRERFGIARLSKRDWQALEVTWIEPDFAIEKTAASDAKRQLFVEHVSAEAVAIAICFTGWHKGGSGWGFVTDPWRFNVATKQWSRGNTKIVDVAQDRLVGDGQWQFGDVDVPELETWWKQHDDRLVAPYGYVHPVVAVRSGDHLAIWARAVDPDDCYKIESDKFVSALFVIRA